MGRAISSYIGDVIHKAQKGEFGEVMEQGIERPGFQESSVSSRSTVGSRAWAQEKVGADVIFFLFCVSALSRFSLLSPIVFSRRSNQVFGET